MKQKRELKQETGVAGFHVKHFGVYDRPDRDPSGWLISNAFYAIVKEDLLKQRKAQDLIAEVELFTIPEALELELAFDHHTIIKDAMKLLTKEMVQTTIAQRFLPNEFTLSELQRVLLSSKIIRKSARIHLFYAKAPKLPVIRESLGRNRDIQKRQIEIRFGLRNYTDLQERLSWTLYTIKGKSRKV